MADDMALAAMFEYYERGGGVHADPAASPILRHPAGGQPR
jgi:hypothetical protein